MTDVTIITASSVTNVGPRYEWYPLAVRDEAFFHVLISSTASHAAYLQYNRNELPRHFYHHRGEAIRLLNQRIEKGAHDEGTINTVAMFSQQEVDISGLESQWAIADIGIELRGSSSNGKGTYRWAKT